MPPPGPSLRVSRPRARPRVHRHCRRGPRAGDWRQCDRLQPRQRLLSKAAAGVAIPTRFVRVYSNRFSNTSYRTYAELRDRNSTLRDLAGFQLRSFGLRIDADNEHTFGEIVTGNYFRTDRHRCRPRPPARPIGRRRRRAAGGRPVARVLDAPVRRGAGRRRAHDCPERPAVHDRRRRAGGIHRRAGAAGRIVVGADGLRRGAASGAGLATATRQLSSWRAG